MFARQIRRVTYARDVQKMPGIWIHIADALFVNAMESEPSMVSATPELVNASAKVNTPGIRYPSSSVSNIVR